MNGSETVRRTDIVTRNN